jgi:dienelactone hydrolase
MLGHPAALLCTSCFSGNEILTDTGGATPDPQPIPAGPDALRDRLVEMDETVLHTGAGLRHSRPAARTVVLALNGGGSQARPGNWSPTIEWLVDRLMPRFPDAGFAELRYRVRSWRMLPSCIADCRAALAALSDADCVVLLGFSMGGAVSLACADDPRVQDVVALAPWIPEELRLEELAGDRVSIIHGSLDGGIPLVPGVRPSHSRNGAERLSAAGADVRYRVIPGGVHGVAVRPNGHLLPLPRAGEWLRLVAGALERAGLERDA